MSQRQPFAHYKSGSNKRKYTSQNLDRLLSRAPPQANFNINYEAYTIPIPNYSFGKPTLLPGSGGLMAIAIGKRLSDELPVLIKLSPYTIRLEREYYIARRLYSQPDGKRYIPQVVELVTLSQDGLTALIYADKGANDLVCLEQRYFSHYRLSVSSAPLQQPSAAAGDGRSSLPDVTPVASPVPSAAYASTTEHPLIDIQTFLRFAIECCSCLQLLHANGIIHGELRPSAFHWHSTKDVMTVKIWNFGAGLKSYEDMLLTSSGWRRAVLAAAAHDDLLDDPTILDPSSRFLPSSSTRGFQHALAYVSPEQTGRTSNVLDHRTDLYSLGIMFFVILTGQTPFDGSPMSVLQAALSQNVPLAHTVRPDVPTALSLIIDKLARKAVDERYNSAYGVREDLTECLRRLQGGGDESLLFFPLGLHDINSVFQFPSTIYGREHEIELLRAAIWRSAQREYDDHTPASVTTSTAPARIASPMDKPLSEVIVITGPGGIGKSTLVSAIHNHARQHGYLGTAKFDSNQKRPYNGLLRCLSSILRQLLTESETVIHDFYRDLKQQLGPHFSNVRLMVGMVPELKPILSDHDHNELDEDMIPNAESRFHAVFLNVLRTIAQKRPITLFLDDLLEADEASLYLISSVIDARIKMLIILTCRDIERLPDCIRDELAAGDEMPNAQVTTIKLAPLGVDVIHQLVGDTLHRTLDSVQPLSEIVYHRTHGNPFYAKQFLLMMKRKGDLWFDWDDKQWKFRLDNIAQILYPPRPSSNRSGTGSASVNTVDAGFAGGVLDVQHLVLYLKEMDQQTQAFVMWASLIGSAFDFRQIKWLMMATDLFTMDDSATDPACSDLSDSISVGSCADAYDRPSFVDHLEYAPMDNYHTPPEDTKRGSQVMAALQMALHEGIIQTTVGYNHYQFTHDRYYQAASMLIDEKDREKMHLRIGQMFMIDSDSDDVFMMADHFVKSVDLIKRFRNRSKYRQVLCKAGEEAVNSGASRIGHTYYSHAMALLAPNPWDEDEDSLHDSSYRETLDLHLRMAELEWWSNRRAEADQLLDEIMEHTANRPVDRARAWRVQARMYFQLQQNDRGIEAIIDALKELGMNDIFLKDEPVPLPLDSNNPAHILQLYNQVKQQIFEIGFEALTHRERCKDRRILAIMTLLNEACTGAYWLSHHLVDLVAIKLVQLSLEHGYGVTSGSGFTWLGCTAARFGEYELGAKLGELGLEINTKYAGNPEIAQAIVVYYGMLSQWSGCHFRDCIVHFERAFKYAVAGGDKIFSSMALFHISTTLFYTGCNLSELQGYLDERIDETSDDEKDVVLTLNVSLWRTVLALQGKTTIEKDMQHVLDDHGVTDSNFKERMFLDDVHRQNSNAGSVFNWHWSLKIIVLVHFDRHQEAAELGFGILETALHHPGHRHIGIAIFYHTIALIACLRNGQLEGTDLRAKYYTQAEQNCQMLKDWATHAKANYGMYQLLLEAEMATLSDDPRSAQLYNDALELGTQGKWYPFLAFAYQLIAEQYIRRNMRMLAMPMLQEALNMYNAVDAWGIAHHLTEKHDNILNNNEAKMVQPVDVAVQTDEQDIYQSVEHGAVWDQILPRPVMSELSGSDSLTSEGAILSLDIVDLTSIIKSSQVISNEMNSFDELLKKMMGIIMTNSAAESGAIIIKEGSFGVAAHSNQSGCETYDPPMPLNDDKGLISTLVVHYVIHTQTILFIPNIREDTRFASGSWFARAGPKSVICIPCIHKNTLVGVLYLQANLNTFTPKHVTVLHILCHQIGISITNALLFKSVQKATQANARMIEKQREALEEARSSREQALKATKLKSNFLANMSHELRTPFSGFYGMIDLLSETRLDPEQREFVFIAKQSCEMLLQIIDDLLDFSKLEARKVKLHCGLFYIEDLIEDRVELLITLASNKKLELTCFTDPDVPPMIYGDGNRIGQVLMNLIGNAIKFTQHGEVVVRCSVEHNPPDPPLKDDELMLKFSVQDTGIGMSEDAIKSLFVPFSQVDGSTTRNFGGTGLGLSICLELVRLMGGDIWVESQVNAGSTFHFRVRVMTPSSVAEPGVDSDRRHREIEQLIQLVDDRRLLLSTSTRQADMITALLPTLSVTRVDTPQQGLELARTHAQDGRPFDFFLVDAPPSEATREMLDATDTDAALHNLHILLLYAPAMDSIRRQIVAGKAVRTELQQHAYDARITRITKPIRRVKLLRTLIKVLGLDAPSCLSCHEQEADSYTTSVPASALVPAVSRGAAAALARRVHETEDDAIPTNTISAENEPHDIKPSYSSPYMKQRSNEAFTPEELAIFQGQRILVAEDNPVAQKLLVKQLARLGFAVETCNNGFECIKTWTKRGPDHFLLAWIDHHMPGCDGIEATKKIRQLEAEMHVSFPMPIIALTADVQKTAQQKCIDAGMTDYLVKPLMQKDLAAVLRRYCSPQHLYTQTS